MCQSGYHPANGVSQSAFAVFDSLARDHDFAAATRDLPMDLPSMTRNRCHSFSSANYTMDSESFAHGSEAKTTKCDTTVHH